MSSESKRPVRIDEEVEEEEDDSQEDLDETYEPEDLLRVTPQPEDDADDAAEAEPSPKGKRKKDEKKKEPEPNPLTRDHLYGNSLTILQHIGQGLSCAYLRMDVPNRELTDISMLEKYIHLRFLDVSHNHLQDVRPLSAMTHLVSLNASQNKLKQLHLEPLPFLQSANLAKNKLTSFEGLAHPNLEKLNMSSNRLRHIRFHDATALNGLRILDIRGNKLETLEGSYPPNLEELYAPANLLRTIGKMEGVTNLKRLHLRDNQIENLYGVDESGLSSLTYLNIRGNNLEEARDLKKLRGISSLTEVIVEGNPLCESDDYRDLVLGALGVNPNIQRVDKEKIIPEDLEYAREAMLKIDSQPDIAAEDEMNEGYQSTSDKSTSVELGFRLNASLNET